MIPRHRERLAQTIGNAVGNELVSQDTVVNALFGTGFFRRKVESFVNTYTDELLNKNYTTFVDALPKPVRAPVLDAISALQMRVADHIADVLKSEETVEAVNNFIERRVDEILAQRLGDTVGEETFEQVLGFVESRFRVLVNERGFETKVRAFVSERVDALAHSQATLAEVLTPDAVAVVKERVDAQVPPIVRRLTEIATNRKTRTQMGALIKREVDDYYEQLSFFKKIFISRDRIHNEVDDLINKTLPRKVEEYLSGEAFEAQAEEFLNSTIDGVLARPVNELVGTVAPDKLELIKDQVAGRILALVRSPELATSVSAYATDALQRLRPHSLRALLEHARPDSHEQLKRFLSKGLVGVLSREDTARTINAILSAQIERLLGRAHRAARRSRARRQAAPRERGADRPHHRRRRRAPARRHQRVRHRRHRAREGLGLPRREAGSARALGRQAAPQDHRAVRRRHRLRHRPHAGRLPLLETFLALTPRTED